MSLPPSSVKQTNDQKAKLLLRRADLLEEIAAVDRKLAEIETQPAAEKPDVYSTHGALPPNRSRRWLREHAREIPCAERRGGLRGRDVEWIVPRDAYEAWRALDSRKRTAPVAQPVVDDVDAAIASAGYRMTRRAS